MSAGEAQEGKAAKTLVLFSDGTGNSSGKLFKTNVWRMYEAVDLGPSPAGVRDQIAYYDNGVGTSGFRPLAWFGGIFGYGLKRNVLTIYRYACRNYSDGDRLYAFGFSRGAFTIRLVVALICSQGLVRSDDEGELLRKSADAYRAFRRDFLPRRLQWPTRFRRAAGAFFRKHWRALRGVPTYDRKDNLRPTIRFVGVWDTVAAYGGPIAEITRAVDNWFYPLSMPNYKLSPRVERARHALAIDDERDSFHPLLWDETYEQRLLAERDWESDEQYHWMDQDRLLQVWFTGMHADVGGGYPDESLSYVSLLWMIAEAEAADLRMVDVITERFRALASSSGPIHDSRAGIGAYYRYQPRKIAAWLHDADHSTRALRDPAQEREAAGAGLLTEVRVHESVVARIANGTDRYAPIALPERFTVIPPERHGENAPQATSDGSPSAATAPAPLVDPGMRARLADPDAAHRRGGAMERIWDLVWRRRLLYFATLSLTLALVTMPLWMRPEWAAPLWSDGRNWVGGIIRLAGTYLPQFTRGVVESFAANSFWSVLLLTGILLLNGLSSGTERSLRDRARAIWTAALVGNDIPRPRSWIERFRRSRLYQGGVRFTKWLVLPDLVIAPLLLLALIWAGVSLWSQMLLPRFETRPRVCPSVGAGLPEIDRPMVVPFSPRALCIATGHRVTEGETYGVSFEVTAPWSDGGVPTTPLGLAAGDLRWGLGYFGVPLRRVPDANYLQPLVAIRPKSGVHIEPLALTRGSEFGNIYQGQFTARRSGELFLFANDAAVPFTGRFERWFYERSRAYGSPVEGNQGAAQVTIFLKRRP